MALRKRGKEGLYSCYFRSVIANPDGTLRYAVREVPLGTADLIEAKALEADIMARNRKARLHQRATAALARLAVEAGEITPDVVPVIAPQQHRKKRLKLADWLEAAEKYRKISETSRKIFNRFVRRSGHRYFDEVTPELALAYLQENYGGERDGKSFNNNKTGINSIYRLLLVDAGMKESPFASIPDRRHVPDHQRPFTLDEFKKIYRTAPDMWKLASLIAWHTGMREETVFNMKWSAIDGDVLTALPGKTARFGRAVRIPLHPQVMDALAKLPRRNDNVFGCFYFYPKSSSFKLAFGKILKQCGISAGQGEKVCFNSFRDSFVTRCDAAGVPRHATRGVVGHVSDDVTDLYSHDLETARRIQKMDSVKLD